MTAPDHWTETTLGEIIKLKPGRYLKKNDYTAGGPFSVYGSNSVMGSHTKPLYDDPLIVMAGIGANAGAVRLSMVPCWVNNNAFAIFASGTTRTEYLYYWLDTQLDLGLVRLGTGQPYIHKDHLKAIPITLPPPHEQRRIVDLLDDLLPRIDSYIDALRIQADAARVIRTSLLHELLNTSRQPTMTDPPPWTETTLGEVAEVNPKEKPLSPDDPFVPMDAVKPRARWVTYFESCANRAGARARRDDILYARMGACLENGKVAQVQPDIERCGGSTEFIVLRAGPKLLPSYLYWWATSPTVKDKAISLLVGTTRPRLRADDLTNFRFHLPPLDEQRRIVDLLDSLFDSINSYIDALEAPASTAHETRAALLHKLLTPPQ